jgi:energy-converting hydrogenase Eha subunit A
MSTAVPAAETRSSIARRQNFQTRPSDHRFFTIMSVVTSVTIIGGFWNTYLPKILTGAPALPPIIHVHAAIFTSWLALFVTQTTLVLNGKTAIHRRLGVAGVVLAALMIVVGTATAITVTRLGHRGIPGVEFSDPAGFLLLNLNAVFVFAVLVAAGWHLRRNAQTHKRLMLMATMSGLVGPGASRLSFASGKPGVIALLVLGFLCAGPIYDLVTRRRVHAAYLWSVPLAFLAVPPIVAQLSASAAWQRVAAMLLR